MIGGERPLLPEILGQNDGVGAQSLMFDLFSPYLKVHYALSNEPKMNIVVPKPSKEGENAKCLKFEQ